MKKHFGLNKKMIKGFERVMSSDYHFMLSLNVLEETYSKPGEKKY